MSDPHERAAHVVAVEDDRLGFQRAPSWPRGTGLKEPAFGQTSSGPGGHGRPRGTRSTPSPVGVDRRGRSAIPAFSMTRREAMLWGSVSATSWGRCSSSKPAPSRRGPVRWPAPRPSAREPSTTPARSPASRPRCAGDRLAHHLAGGRSRRTQSPKPWRSQWATLAARPSITSGSVGGCPVADNQRATRGSRSVRRQLGGVFGRRSDLAAASAAGRAIRYGSRAPSFSRPAPPVARPAARSSGRARAAPLGQWDLDRVEVAGHHGGGKDRAGLVAQQADRVAGGEVVSARQLTSASRASVAACAAVE